MTQSIQACPQCRGAGKIIKEKCTACLGNGYISRKKKLSVSIPAGIDSGQCIRLAGNNDNLFTRILSAPGLAMQRITTREPDDSMIEIAIAAMKPCIPEDKEEDRW